MGSSAEASVASKFSPDGASLAALMWHDFRYSCLAVCRAANSAPGADEVREALTGNLCRCAGYGKIIEAVQLRPSRYGPGGVRPGARARAGAVGPAQFPRAPRPARCAHP